MRRPGGSRSPSSGHQQTKVVLGWCRAGLGADPAIASLTPRATNRCPGGGDAGCPKGGSALGKTVETAAGCRRRVGSAPAEDGYCACLICFDGRLPASVRTTQGHGGAGGVMSMSVISASAMWSSVASDWMSTQCPGAVDEYQIGPPKDGGPEIDSV